MKLRIKHNSIRFRLTQSDVSRLVTIGNLYDSVSFGALALGFAVRSTSGVELSATFTDNVVTLHMPLQMIEELADTDRIGFEANEGDLHLLVEKDFTCLENVAEDQSDNYPNPLAHQHHEK